MTFSVSCVLFCFSCHILLFFMYNPQMWLYDFLPLLSLFEDSFFRHLMEKTLRLLGHKNEVPFWYANKAEVKRALISCFLFFGGGMGMLVWRSTFLKNLGEGMSAEWVRDIWSKSPVTNISLGKMAAEMPSWEWVPDVALNSFWKL